MKTGGLCHIALSTSSFPWSLWQQPRIKCSLIQNVILLGFSARSIFYSWHCFYATNVRVSAKYVRLLSFYPAFLFKNPNPTVMESVFPFYIFFKLIGLLCSFYTAPSIVPRRGALVELDHAQQWLNSLFWDWIPKAQSSKAINNLTSLRLCLWAEHWTLTSSLGKTGLELSRVLKLWDGEKSLNFSCSKVKKHCQNQWLMLTNRIKMKWRNERLKRKEDLS